MTDAQRIATLEAEVAKLRRVIVDLEQALLAERALLARRERVKAAWEQVEDVT